MAGWLRANPINPTDWCVISTKTAYTHARAHAHQSQPCAAPSVFRAWLNWESGWSWYFLVFFRTPRFHPCTWRHGSCPPTLDAVSQLSVVLFSLTRVHSRPKLQVLEYLRNKHEWGASDLFLWRAILPEVWGHYTSCSQPLSGVMNEPL